MLLFWTLIPFDSYAYSYKSRGCRMCNSPLHFHGMGSWQKIGCKEQPTARSGPSREKGAVAKQKCDSNLYKEIVQKQKPGTLFEPFWP